MGFFQTLKTSDHILKTTGHIWRMLANSNLARDNATKKVSETECTFTSLERLEANLAGETSQHPVVVTFRLALRKSIEAWKETHDAYATVARACQLNIDAVNTFSNANGCNYQANLVTIEITALAATKAVSLSEAAHLHAIAAHKEFLQANGLFTSMLEHTIKIETELA